MKIAVLAGGLSPEHDVSMSSGALAASALAKRGHAVALCDVYRPISSQKSASYGEKREFSCEIPPAPPSLDKMKKEYTNGRLVGDGVLELCLEADVCFLALHGGAGEDGHIQALLECYGIPYTGSDMPSCHIAMDKYISKLLCERAGISVPRGVVVNRGETVAGVSYPAAVKPCSCGSSVGVSFAENEKELSRALAAAFEYEDRVLIEERVSGREFSVSVLGKKALPSVEIIPKSGFYDFESKYQSGMTEEICPGNLTDREEQEAERLALLAHKTLGLGDYSRSDFILSGGKFYYLETNALPGMTENSLLPLAARAVGISYAELCEKICALAIERTKK